MSESAALGFLNLVRRQKDASASTQRAE